MLQVSNLMRRQGLGPESLLGAGGGGFPAPGNPNAPPSTASPTSQTSTGSGAAASGGAQQSPFGSVDPAALLQMLGAGGMGAGGLGAGGLGAGGLGAGGLGAGGLGGLGGLGAGGLGSPGAGFPPLFGSPPADTRSPEERFQVQLQVRFALLAVESEQHLTRLMFGPPATSRHGFQ
jgi:ubiquilin